MLIHNAVMQRSHTHGTLNPALASGPSVPMWEVASSIGACGWRADDELFGCNGHLRKKQLLLRLPLARKSSGRHPSLADRFAATPGNQELSTTSRLSLTRVQPIE